MSDMDDGEYIDCLKEQVAWLLSENEKLRKALKPFADQYQDNGLLHSMHIFEMKDLLAAKKVLGERE